MSSWRNAKVAWCVRCNCERPLRKSRGNGENAPKGSRIHVCTVCFDRVELPTKMRSKPTASKHTLGRNGKPRIFQSKKEANREPALVALLNSGQIRDLRYQGPAYRFQVYSNGPVGALLEVAQVVANQHRGTPVGQQIQTVINDVQRSIVSIPGGYVPDFTYFETGTDVYHVEDPKGPRTMQYRRSKALMLACFGIEVEEPGEGGVQQRARGCGVHGRGTGSRLLGGR